MRYLLDTNVVSELRKRPDVVNPGVVDWAGRQATSDLYLSVVTLLEIELGIIRLQRRDPDQAAILRQWMDRGVLAGFAGRVVPIDADIAVHSARLLVPDPRPERDAYIAATAQVRGLTVVTRNVADFEPTGVTVLSPWTLP